MALYSGEVLAKRTPPPCFTWNVGFMQDQALLGILEIDAAAVGILDDGFVVGRGIVAEDGKAKAVLPFERAVAATVVAAVLGEQRRDIALEAERRFGVPDGRQVRKTVRCDVAFAVL